MSYDIILYQADPVTAEEIAEAWTSIGAATAHDDYAVVDAGRGVVFAYIDSLEKCDGRLAHFEADELASIEAITEPVHNFNLRSSVPELLNEGFLKFPASDRVAVDNDNGFIGPLEEAIRLAREGTDWLRNPA